MRHFDRAHDVFDVRPAVFCYEAIELGALGDVSEARQAQDDLFEYW